MEFKHKSIMLQEVLEGLSIKDDGTYVDGTVGGGGHSYYICKRLKNGKLIGIDQDAAAIKAATKRLSEFPFVKIVKNNYVNMDTVLSTSLPSQ